MSFQCRSCRSLQRRRRQPHHSEFVIRDSLEQHFGFCLQTLNLLRCQTCREPFVIATSPLGYTCWGEATLGSKSMRA